MQNDKTHDEATVAICPIVDRICYGAKCMAWRWSTPDGEEPRGYCGLAGMPPDALERATGKFATHADAIVRAAHECTGELRVSNHFTARRR